MPDIIATFSKFENKGMLAWNIADKIIEARNLLLLVQNIPQIYWSFKKALSTYYSFENGLKSLKIIKAHKETRDAIQRIGLLQKKRPLLLKNIPQKIDNTFLKQNIKISLTEVLKHLKTTKNTIRLIKNGIENVNNKDTNKASKIIDDILNQVKRFEKNPNELRPQLNDDIIKTILAYEELECEDLINIQTVSKRFNTLSKQEVLQRYSFCRFKSITNAYSYFGPLLEKISYIDITNLSGKDKDYYKFLKKLTNIEKLKISVNPKETPYKNGNCSGPSNKSLYKLSKLKQLRSIVIDDSQINNEMELITKLHIKSLSVNYSNLSETAVISLGKISTIISLNLNNCNLCEKIDKLNLESLSHIEKLHLPHNKLEKLSFLENITTLTNLNLLNNNIEDKKLVSLEKLLHLINLDLSHNKITSIGIKHIKKLPLCSLDVSHNDISDQAMDSIGEMLTLQDLDLSHNRITGDKLNKLNKLLNLSVLDLSCNDIVDSSISHLSNLYNLQYLRLSKTKINGESIFSLSSMKHLELLDLSDNVFTKQGCNQLLNLVLQCSTLETLILKDCKPRSLFRKLEKILEKHNPNLQVISTDADSEDY